MSKMTPEIQIENIPNGFKNDPVYFKSLIGKKVEIKQSNDALHTGEVYCIDPVSESIILINKSGDKYNTDILLGYTIQNIRVLSEEISSDVVFKSKKTVCSEGLEEKKVRIKEWLKKHLIDIEESGDELKIRDDLTILPPYTIETCISSNTIILQRIQDILSKMPDC